MRPHGGRPATGASARMLAVRVARAASLPGWVVMRVAERRLWRARWPPATGRRPSARACAGSRRVRRGGRTVRPPVPGLAHPPRRTAAIGREIVQRIGCAGAIPEHCGAFPAPAEEDGVAPNYNGCRQLRRRKGIKYGSAHLHLRFHASRWGAVRGRMKVTAIILVV